MLSCLASGQLVRDPEQRRSTSGRVYATALARVPAEDAEAMLVSLIAFNADAVAALLALTKGDSLAVAGRAKLSAWQKNGEDHHGLSMVVDQVLTVYAIEKRRRQTRQTEGTPA